MKFFAYMTLAHIANAANTFTQAEKEELFEVWTAQAESGEMSPEVYGMLAQALDGDAPEEFYSQCDALADETEIPAEFLQTDAIHYKKPFKGKKKGEKKKKGGPGRR